MKDRTVTRNGTAHIIVPLTGAEAASAEVFEYLRISGYCISSLAISKKNDFFKPPRAWLLSNGGGQLLRLIAIYGLVSALRNPTLVASARTAAMAWVRFCLLR